MPLPVRKLHECLVREQLGRGVPHRDVHHEQLHDIFHWNTYRH